MKEDRTSVHNNSTIRGTPIPPGDDLGAAELGRRVANNLREKRKERGLSLDELAIASGVSRASLSQIETGRSNPSLGTLWKIAVGLGLPFAELVTGNEKESVVLRRSDSQILRSTDGRMESRPLMPAGACPWVEVYELRLLARSNYHSDAHAQNTREVVIVLSGQLRVRAGTETFELAAGDSVAFRADQPHDYENFGGSETRFHNLVIYAR